MTAYVMMLLCVLLFIYIVLCIYNRRNSNDVIAQIKEYERKKELVKQHMRVNHILEHTVKCLDAVNASLLHIGKNTDKIYAKFGQVTPDIIKLFLDADFVKFIQSQDAPLNIGRRIKEIAQEIIKISRCKYNSPKIAKYFDMSDKEIVSSFVDEEFLSNCRQLKKLENLID